MSFAHFVIYMWPLVSYRLFVKLGFQMALCITLIGAYLLLPSRIKTDLPALPSIDKDTIAVLAALMWGAQFAKKRPADVFTRVWPSSVWFTLLLVILYIGIFGTYLTNGDSYTAGPRILPGLGLADLNAAVLDITVQLAPLFLAWRFLGSDRGNLILLQVIVFAAAAYGVLALYEVRMSPQLAKMVYGQISEQWGQHRRAGGWRPFVFMEHGLILGIFLSMATIGAMALIRIPGRLSMKARIGLALYLLVVLVLSKTLGALAIAFTLFPLALLFRTRIQLLVVGLLAVVVLSYPTLRHAGLVPTDEVVEFFEDISLERAGSLEFRLDHEEALLDKARERPAFGWGGWGRFRVYDENGYDVSVTDGYWVIIFGAGGWARYVGEFGLYAMPLLLLGFGHGRQISRATAALALMLVANLVDILVNGSSGVMLMLLSGALWGNLDHHRRGTASGPDPQGRLSEADVTPAPTRSGYTRFPKDTASTASRPGPRQYGGRVRSS